MLKNEDRVVQEERPEQLRSFSNLTSLSNTASVGLLSNIATRHVQNPYLHSQPSQPVSLTLIIFLISRYSSSTSLPPHTPLLFPLQNCPPLPMRVKP